MAGKRFTIVNSPYNCIPTVEFQTDAAATIIEKGMLLMTTSDGSPYATPCVTGDFTIGTDSNIVGLAADDSTHTTTADGVIHAYMPLPGIIYRAYATTSGNVDTAAKVLALLGDRVVITVSATTSAGDWTVDEDATDGAASAFHLIAGDYEKGTVDFIIRHAATYLGDAQED